MPPVDDDLQRFAAGNRARIEILEAEMQRTRDRLHEQSTNIGALALALAPLRELPGAVVDLREALDRYSRRAIERPRAAAVSATASWCSVVIAVVALLVVVIQR